MVTGVLADEGRIDVGLVPQLADPLPHRGHAGGDDERVHAALHQRGQTDHGLARAAGQHEHAVATCCRALRPPGADRVTLVAAQLARERAGERGAVDVARFIGRRPSELDEGLLQRTAVAEAHREPIAVEPLAEQTTHRLVATDLFEQRGFGAREGKGARVEVAHDRQPAVAAHLVVDLREHARRYRVLRERVEGHRHLARAQPRGRGVPQRQRRHAVGVDVLRCLLQLGEAGEHGAGFLRPRTGHFEQYGEIALDDERVRRVSHRTARPSLRASSPVRAWPGARPSPSGRP